MRVCEELFYHCQNDHRYVTELKTALKEIGLDQSKIVQRQYILKDDFKNEDLYKTGWVFINERILKDRKDVYGIPESIRNNPFSYTAMTGTTGTDAMMEEGRARDDAKIELKNSKFTVREIASILRLATLLLESAYLDDNPEVEDCFWEAYNQIKSRIKRVQD